MTLNPFAETRRLVGNLQEALENVTPHQDETSYPIGGEAYNLLGSSGERIVRIEIHGGTFQDPYHVDIRASQSRVLDAARSLFEGRRYGFGNAYLYDEADPQKDREQLQEAQR